MKAMSKDEFCDHFVATFCASWCAKNYWSACIRAQYDRLENPPIEDAVHLAGQAWEKYVNAIGV